MATTTTTNPKISMKLLIDTNSNKVLFAEAGKDFVDLLFGLLELPLGTILALLTEHDDTAATFGSLSRVYQSVQNLDNDYLQPNQTKDTLLTPKIGASNTAHTPLLKQFLGMANPPNPRQCPALGSSLAFSSSSSPAFGSSSSAFGTSSSPAFGSSSSAFGTSSSPAFGTSSSPAFGSSAVTSNVNVNMVQGYVKGVVTYMVMDDLMVKPMSSISSIALLNNLKVKDITCLQEKTVTVDMDEGLKLLRKAFSKSTTVLTDMFLPIKPM